ncbi:hypothetical protein J3R83DRAFT_10465 [Lanmaoa asiatica]|nr:hypothetical protein J3R83DRAFT_10465 [Lanmaoa asiatica]
MFPCWNWTLIAVSVSFHSVAILSTVFRLWYRWYTARMWWDDAWAVLAFLADVAFLIAAVLEQPIQHDPFPRFFTIGNWIISFAYPTLMWAARMSILTSMVHVSRPEGMLRHVTVGIGISFGIMGLAMLGYRVQPKSPVSIRHFLSPGFHQPTVTADCVGDLLLSALPIWCLRDLSLKRKQKILVASAFSASMVISIVTIVEAVMLFQSITSGSIVFEHVKVACTMIVCNLLVIVTFVYRILHNGETRFKDSIPETNKIVFTTVDLAHGGLTQEASMGWSLPALSETTKSSNWSFCGSSQSQISTDILNAVGSEGEHYGGSIS